jgi:hypothetical protein
LDTENKDIELPIFLMKEVFLEDNKIIVKLSENRSLDYFFDNYKSAEKIYNNIIEKMNRVEKE